MPLRESLHLFKPECNILESGRDVLIECRCDCGFVFEIRTWGFHRGRDRKYYISYECPACKFCRLFFLVSAVLNRP